MSTMIILVVDVLNEKDATEKKAYMGIFFPQSTAVQLRIWRSFHFASFRYLNCGSHSNLACLNNSDPYWW